MCDVREIASNMTKARELANSKKQKTLALCVNWAPPTVHKPEVATPVSERSWRRAHWHGRLKVSQGLSCGAGAALSQGQVQIAGGAGLSTDFLASQHFHKVKDIGAALSQAAAFRRANTLSQGRVQISWQAQRCRKGKHRDRGGRTFLQEREG